MKDFYRNRWARRADAVAMGILAAITLHVAGFGILPIVDPDHFVGIIAGGQTALVCGHSHESGWVCNLDGVLEQ